MYRCAMSIFCYHFRFCMSSNLNFIVLHPKYKLTYFWSKKWLEEWVDAAQLVLQEQWTTMDNTLQAIQLWRTWITIFGFKLWVGELWHTFILKIKLTSLSTRLRKRVSSSLWMTLAPMLALMNLKSTSTLQQYLQRILTLSHGGMQLACQVHWLGWELTFYQHLVSGTNCSMICWDIDLKCMVQHLLVMLSMDFLVVDWLWQNFNILCWMTPHGRQPFSMPGVRFPVSYLKLILLKFLRTKVTVWREWTSRVQARTQRA